MSRVSRAGSANIAVVIIVVIIFAAGGFLVGMYRDQIFNWQNSGEVTASGTSERTDPRIPSEREILSLFENSWDELQNQIPFPKVAGGTTWTFSDSQFIRQDRFLVYFEDGHVAHTGLFEYRNDGTVQPLVFYEAFPFSKTEWKEIITRYGDNLYSPKTLVKSAVQNGERVRYSDWTEIPGNPFVRSETAANFPQAESVNQPRAEFIDPATTDASFAPPTKTASLSYFRVSESVVRSGIPVTVSFSGKNIARYGLSFTCPAGASILLGGQEGCGSEVSLAANATAVQLTFTNTYPTTQHIVAELRAYGFSGTADDRAEITITLNP